MHDGIVTQVKEALTPVADKLQQGAEFMYGVYLRQTVVEGIVKVAVPLMLLIAATIFIVKFLPYARLMHKKFEEKRKSGWEDNFWVLIIVGVIGGYIIGLAVCIGFMVSGALQLANPHFYTIDRIIQSVKARDVK